MLAQLVRLVVVAVPVGASVAVAAALSVTLPHARHLTAALLWWAVVVVASTATLLVADRLARRLLPLALLLRLSLLFPDEAPKRYRVAVRAWSTRALRERADGVRPADSARAPIEAVTQILGLLANLTIHDRGTRGHCERVRAFNDMIAEELRLPEADRERLRWAALIHDIGKLDVPRRLLNKPGRPSAKEWRTLRAHPVRGAAIAAPLRGWLGPWADAIEQHHERWDGAGYPHGLRGDRISLAARIVAVADAFEVMTSARPYSRAVSASAAREELARCAGSHFDPDVVRAFLAISLRRLRKVMGPMSLVGQVPFLASMPRLEAAVLGGGHALGGAGAAAGIVAASTFVPDVVAHPPAAHPAPGVHHHHVPSPRQASTGGAGGRSADSAPERGPASAMARGASTAAPATRRRSTARPDSSASAGNDAAGDVAPPAAGRRHREADAGGSPTPTSVPTPSRSRRHGGREEAPSRRKGSTIPSAVLPLRTPPPRHLQAGRTDGGETTTGR